MRRTLFAACAIAFPAFLTSASAAPVIYLNEADFVAALSGPQSLVDFSGSVVGPISGNEFSSQGLLFDSPVPSPLGQLEVAFFNANPYLNIDNEPGECCDGWNDSLEVTILGNWSAVGFAMVDTSIPSSMTESIRVYDRTGGLIYAYGHPQGSTGYFGIVSDVPIGRVSIAEDAGDSDDAGYDSFRLGNRGVVPEPSTLLLLGSGLAALGRFARKRVRG